MKTYGQMLFNYFVDEMSRDLEDAFNYSMKAIPVVLVE